LDREHRTSTNTFAPQPSLFLKQTAIPSGLTAHPWLLSGQRDVERAM
jgi:hypothetical protein